MKGYFIDEMSYNVLIQMAKVQVTISNDYNFLDVLETATPMEIP